MGQPAAIMGDKVMGTCAIHLIPNPATGAPQPGPPMPFSAPLTTGTCATVQISDTPAAVVGSQGMNTPPHIGLHPADPFMVHMTELGVVTAGSTTVLFGGVPAARTGDPGTCCGMPGGSVLGSGATVLIG
jgi:uncharacterized Zn-binding protein involved in type VI secretion